MSFMTFPLLSKTIKIIIFLFIEVAVGKAKNGQGRARGGEGIMRRYQWVWGCGVREDESRPVIGGSVMGVEYDVMRLGMGSKCKL